MSYNNIIIERKLREFLEEDCAFQDVTSNFIDEDNQKAAKIIAKSKGFISGLAELKILYDILKVETNFIKKDGEEVKKGDIIVINEEKYFKPIAIAKTLYNSFDVSTKQHGKIAENLHYIGDSFWKAINEL